MLSSEQIAAIAAAAVAAAAAIVFVVRRNRNTEAPLLKFSTDTATVRVYTIRQDDGRDTRIMEVDGAQQSATYIDDDLCYDLVFGYHKVYDRMFDASLPIRNVLVLGGGGYAYPEHLISTYPDMHVDVVEIDEGITAIAQRYFFLDRLVVEYDTDTSGRLGLICDDARHYLDGCSKRYDAICNDCFSGRRPVASLATVEAARAIHEHLVDGGIFLSNVIGSVRGSRSLFVHAVMTTLAEVFEHVYIIPGKPHSPASPDNNIVIATDGPWEFEGAVTLRDMEYARVLEDATVDDTDWTIPFED